MGKGGKQNGGLMTPQMGNLQQMETKMANAAWSMYEHILHLDTSMEALQKEWNSIAALRVQILKTYGVPVTWTPAGAGAGVIAPVGGAAAGPEVSAKSKLQTLICRKIKRSLQKDELTYQVMEAEGGYIASLSCATGLLASDYQSETAQKSKKDAEADVARMAIEAEYPEAENPAAMLWPQKGTKRKAESQAVASAEIEPKSKLNNALMLLIGRACIKGDITYDSVQQGEMYVGTCKVAEFQGGKTFTGPPAETKKAAESAAAEKAYAAWAHLIGPAEVEHKAKKAAKAKAQAEVWAAKREEMKAAKLAAAAAQ